MSDFDFEQEYGGIGNYDWGKLANEFLQTPIGKAYTTNRDWQEATMNRGADEAYDSMAKLVPPKESRDQFRDLYKYSADAVAGTVNPDGTISYKLGRPMTSKDITPSKLMYDEIDAILYNGDRDYVNSLYRDWQNALAKEEKLPPVKQKNWWEDIDLDDIFNNSSYKESDYLERAYYDANDIFRDKLKRNALEEFSRLPSAQQLKSRPDFVGESPFIDTKNFSGLTGNVRYPLEGDDWESMTRILSMTPREYLMYSNAGYMNRPYSYGMSNMNTENIANYANLMDEGSKAPLIYLRFSPTGELIGQEGRHRAAAAMMLGEKKIPVAVNWQHPKKT